MGLYETVVFGSFPFFSNDFFAEVSIFSVFPRLPTFVGIGVEGTLVLSEPNFV